MTDTTPPGDDAMTRDPGSRPPASLARIGRYTVRRVIASGGMGTVLEAVQDEPRRPVAIKIMKGGIATPEALRRFQFEAQLLARLRHPAIAQIYEAGTHDDGSVPVPFFAMEYIPNAKSITEYANTRRLGFRERLELFSRVCDAVHHGHQKGVIHRDIKPGNILVDSDGAPHIIDFGVARASDSDAARPDHQTMVGELVGTVAYMSPEQFDADPYDLDMRSDVYSLGVVLHELLTGSLPYDLGSAKIHEVARIVRDVEPDKLRPARPEAPVEVETIVHKALEKDRERRYQSAFDLGEDIRRFLNGQPIAAAPQSAAYQLRVFAKRQKPLLAGVGAVFAILIAGVVVSTSLYLRAERERALAEGERARSQAAIDFMTNTLSELLPVGFDEEPTIGDLADRMALNIDGAFPDDPAVESEVRRTIAWGYLSKQDWSAMVQQLERAIDLRKRSGDEDSEKLIELYDDLQVVTNIGGQTGKHVDAHRALLRIHETRWGVDDARTLGAQAGLTEALAGAYQLAEAWELAQSTLARRRKLLGAEHAQTLESEKQVGWLMLARGEAAEAEAYNEAVLRTSRQALGEAHYLTRQVTSQLAACLISQGKIDAARELYGNRPMMDDLGVEARYQGVPELQTDNELLVFWETWCPFSQRTVPRLQQVDRRYRDVGVLGLTLGRPPSTDDKVREFIEEKALTFPVAKIGSPPWEYYDVTGTPFIVLGHDGYVIWEKTMDAPELLLEGMVRGLSTAEGE